MMALFAGLTVRQGRSRIALRSIRATRRLVIPVSHGAGVVGAGLAACASFSPRSSRGEKDGMRGSSCSTSTTPPGRLQGRRRAATPSAARPPTPCRGSPLTPTLSPREERGERGTAAPCHAANRGGSCRGTVRGIPLQTTVPLRQGAFTIVGKTCGANHHQIFDIAVGLLSQVASCGRRRLRFALVLREAG
jgi:hypothetical protein